MTISLNMFAFSFSSLLLVAHVVLPFLRGRRRGRRASLPAADGDDVLLLEAFFRFLFQQRSLPLFLRRRHHSRGVVWIEFLSLPFSRRLNRRRRLLLLFFLSKRLFLRRRRRRRSLLLPDAGRERQSLIKVVQSLVATMEVILGRNRLDERVEKVGMRARRVQNSRRRHSSSSFLLLLLLLLLSGRRRARDTAFGNETIYICILNSGTQRDKQRRLFSPKVMMMIRTTSKTTQSLPTWTHHHHQKKKKKKKTKRRLRRRRDDDDDDAPARL